MLNKKLPLTINMPIGTKFDVVYFNGMKMMTVIKRKTEPGDHHSCCECALRHTNLCDVLECFASVYSKIDNYEN